MKKLLSISVAALALAGCTTVSETAQRTAAVPAEAAAPKMSADEAFAQISSRYIEVMAEMNPVYATQLGEHKYDGELPDISAEGRERQAKNGQAFLIALRQFDPSQLSRDNQVDYALLVNALEYAQWSDAELQEWAWNPQVYNDIASYSLYGLVARDFAPWPQRFDNIVSRMEKLPGFLATAREQIDVARVPKVHAETVSKQNAGILAIVDAALLPEVEQSGVERTRFDKALAGLKTAVAQHQTWLDDVLVPGAKGEFRLGAELYDKKMGFALMSRMDRQTLQQSAEAAFVDARAQMEEVARVFPDCDVSVQQAAIECALEKSYAVRATRTTQEDTARETLKIATDFTREKGFVRMPDGPVEIITMPKFWQGNAVAYLDAPSALEKHLPAFYAVSPVPDDWSDEQAESFLKEYNTYMLHELSIHEGVPGHYLQLDHANKNPSLLRAVLGSGPFVEGWAVYSEKVMADHDYLGGMATRDGQLFRLTMLKMRLRSVTNTLLDIGIHTEGMTRGDAMKLMMDGAFQQEREAAGKWTRANLSSVQLLSYFTGFEEHRALRAEAEERAGDAFNEREYHDELLSHGSPPVKYARALLFGLPVE